MYKLLLSTALVAVASSAMAADLPSRKAPEPYSPVPAMIAFSWTGFYIGANAGVGFNNGNNNNGYTSTGFPAGGNGNPNGNIFNGSGNGSNASFIGGGQLGYNYQFGSIVLGVETDIQGIANGGGNRAGGVAPIQPGVVAGVVPYAIGSNGNNMPSYIGTVRGRLGYAIDRALIYATGGFAYGGGYGNNNVAYFNQANGTGVPTAVYGGGHSSNTGYAVGGGVEYAVTNNWTVKAEYLYANLGSSNRTLFSGTIPGTAFVGGNNNSGINIVRVGVNYKF